MAGSREHRVVLYGWALAGASPSTSTWLVVRLRSSAGGEGKRYYATTWARAPREDVGHVYGPGPGIALTAIDLIGTLQQGAPGTYDVDMVVGGPKGPESCATSRQLVAV